MRQGGKRFKLREVQYYPKEKRGETKPILLLLVEDATSHTMKEISAWFEYAAAADTVLMPKHYGDGDSYAHVRLRSRASPPIPLGYHRTMIRSHAPQWLRFE
jgi:hypothetical protein